MPAVFFAVYVLVATTSLPGGAVGYVLRDWVDRRFGPRLRKLNDGVARDGVLYLFMLRLVPAIPFLLVNVGMGLTCMRAWRYYWVSQAP